MNLIRCMTALISDVWLLAPELHKTLTDIVYRHAAGGDLERAQHAIAIQMQANPGNRQYQIVDRTAVMPVEGIIGRKFSDMLHSSGVTSVDVMERILGAIETDDQVDSCLMVYDSPGGYSMGVPEAAATIARVNAVKPIVAYADGQMCSAAYWLASQSSAIWATPSADTGSIGAYIALLDQTRAMEMQGYHTEIFRSGKHKGMGYPGVSLSDEQRDMLQRHVDKVADTFKASVLRGRASSYAASHGRAPRADDMQGQSFDSPEALAAGLIDRIGPIDEAMREASEMGSKKHRAEKRR